MTQTLGRTAHTATTCWLIGALLLSGSNPASHATQEAPAPESIELSGDLELSRLVELVSQRLGVSVQYTAADLSKRVTLRLRGPVTNVDLWRILSAALESQQLAIVRTEQPGLFRVLPMQQAAAQPPEMHAAQQEEVLAGDLGASFTSTIVQLRSADPAEIAAALSPVMTPQVGQVKPIGSGGLLLISDLRQRVDLALALIERLDGPADPAVRFTIDLAQASATETAALAQQALAARLAASGQRAPAVAGSGGGAAGALTGAQFIPLPDDQRLMIVASASQESELRQLIEELDVREALETRSYSAPGIDPKDLADTIKGLLETRAAEAAKSQSQPTRVAADRLSGAVLVTARTRDHERIGELIERIVAAPPSSRRTLQSFVVRNRSATELMATLQQLLASDPGSLSTISAEGIQTAPTTTGNRSGVRGPTSPLETSTPSNTVAAGSESTSPAVDRPGSALPGAGVPGLPGVTVDESTNTILAVGDPTSLAQLGALITALDKRQPQVMIEVSLVSLSESEAIDFGVELRTQFERGGTTFNLSSLFGLGTGTALPTGVGFTGVAINPGDFEVVVRALETVDAGRSASTPKVLVNNSQTASLRAVLRQPFTSLNASDTVATTSFGGTQDAGTTVTVTPQIAAGDHLILRYSVELSAFTGESTSLPGGGVIPPPSQQNTVDASATIPDGYTVIVGGLETMSTGTNNTRVPLLGQIPVLGWLFGTQSDSESRQRFYVFIRATVLRDAGFADLKRLSAPDVAEARPQIGAATGAPELDALWID